MNAPAPTRLFRLLTLPELRNLPPVRWLVDKHIPLNAQVLLYGPSGGGKSFDALDLALSVATGEPWLGGFDVISRGAVVYIAGEGASGMNARVQAWVTKRGVPEPDNVYFLSGPAALMDTAETDALLAAIARLDDPPVLIVVDTLARCLIGGDENSSRDVGLYISNLDRLKDAFGATVLTLHHTGRNESHERGSTALKGAMDTSIHLDGKPGVAAHRLICDKLKDGAPPFATISAQLHPSEDGSTCTVSVMAGPVNGVDGARETKQSKDAAAELADLRLIVGSLVGGQVQTMKQIQDATGISRTTLYRRMEMLKNDSLSTETNDDFGYGFVEKSHDGYRLTETGERWADTEGISARPTSQIPQSGTSLGHETTVIAINPTSQSHTPPLERGGMERDGETEIETNIAA